MSATRPTPSDPPTSRIGRLAASARLPDLALGSVLVAQLVSAVILVRGTWFQLDAWEFLTSRGTIPRVDHGLFTPWGGHWETVPVLVYRAVFTFVGMRHYLPYALAADLVHLAVVTVMYCLLARLGVNRWLAFGAAFSILFYGAGAELFLTDAPMPLSMGLLCGLMAAYVCVRGDFKGDSRFGAALLLIVGVMCSAVGLVSVGFVTMFALLRASKRTAVTIVAPAAIVFATWFVVRGHSGGRLHLTGDALIRTPQFVWVGLSATTGDWLGVPNSGGLLLIALVLCTLLVRDVAPALRDLAWAGQAAAVAQMALSALANYFLGISAANVGRYEYVAFVFLVPSGVIGAYGIGRAVHNGVRGRQATAAAVLASVLLIAAAVNGLAEERERMVSTRAFSGIYRSWILGTRDAQAAGETVLTAHPSDGFNQPMDMSLVTDLAAMGALPPTREASDRLAAESQFFVEVGAVDPHRFTPTHVTYHGLERRGRGRGALDGCQVLVPDGTGAPTVDVSTGNGTEVGIVSNASVVTTQVYRAYIGSGTRTWPVLPGAIYISTSAHDAILRITLNATEKFSLCHQ